MCNLNCQITGIPLCLETCKDITSTSGYSVFGKSVYGYFPLSKLCFGVKLAYYVANYFAILT